MAPGANVLKLFTAVSHNKREHLFLASLSNLVQCLWVRPGAYPRVEHLKGACYLGWHLALPANIRPGWKGLPGTNALAYYEKVKLTAVKSFIILTTGSIQTLDVYIIPSIVEFFTNWARCYETF